MLVGIFLFSPPVSLVSAENPAALQVLEAAKALKAENRLDEAEKELKKAVNLEPSNPELHFELANVLVLQYDRMAGVKSQELASKIKLELARRELEQTIMLDPQSIEARYNLAVVYKNLKEYEKAREMFKEVLEIKPDLVNAHMQIGAVYEEQGFYDEAKDSYRRAKDLDYANPAIQSALEDLKVRRQEEEVRERKDLLSRYDRLGSALYPTPNSKAAFYQNEKMNQRASGQSLTAAIPFLGSWLIQEYVKRKGQ